MVNHDLFSSSQEKWQPSLETAIAQPHAPILIAHFRKSWKSCLSLTQSYSCGLEAEQKTRANINREDHRFATDMRVTITKCLGERLCDPSHAMFSASRWDIGIMLRRQPVVSNTKASIWTHHTMGQLQSAIIIL